MNAPATGPYGSPPTRLAGKRAIVTGTSPNIGIALARGLAAHGAFVACTDLVAENAERAAAEVERDGGTAMALVGDVTDPDDVVRHVGAVVAEWGGVDVLVNSAAWIHQRSIADIAVDDFRRQLDVTLTGALLMTRVVTGSMVEAGAGGSVVNVLSTAALQGQPGNIGYTTAKGGLLNFTRSAAMELAPYRIRVNGLTPTATRTTDPDAARIQAGRTGLHTYRNEFELLFPWESLPTPDDYVGGLVFLASDESVFMTGANLVIDGGAGAKYWPLVPSRAT